MVGGQWGRSKFDIKINLGGGGVVNLWKNYSARKVETYVEAFSGSVNSSLFN